MTKSLVVLILAVAAVMLLAVLVMGYRDRRERLTAERERRRRGS